MTGRTDGSRVRGYFYRVSAERGQNLGAKFVFYIYDIPYESNEFDDNK